MKHITIAIITVVLASCAPQPTSRYHYYDSEHFSVFDRDISKEWFQGSPMTITEVDVNVYRDFTTGKQSGATRFTLAWEKIKSEMKPGDIIRFYSTPCEMWNNWPNGKAGVALVRNGKLVVGLKLVVQ